MRVIAMGPRVKRAVAADGECPVTRATVRFGPPTAHTGAVSDSSADRSATSPGHGGLGGIHLSDTLRRGLVVLAVLALLAGVVFAFTLVDTDDGTNDIAVTDAGPVEQLIPPRDSEILRQEAVGVDLRPGWTGVLIVNGVEIPEDQVDDDNVASLGQLLYTPGAGKVIERFEAGENCVTAVVWRVQESRADSRNVPWCFNVT